MFIQGLIFFIFVSLIGGFFYIMGKLFYDNSEVRAQFEPLSGVIAYQKHIMKNKDVKKDDAKFYAKYKIQTRAIEEIADKQ